MERDCWPPKEMFFSLSHHVCGGERETNTLATIRDLCHARDPNLLQTTVNYNGIIAESLQPKMWVIVSIGVSRQFPLS